jgi:hypothetical protein
LCNNIFFFFFKEKNLIFLLKIVDVTALFSPHIDFFKKINNFNSENSDFKVLALSFPDCADFIKNKDFSDWQALAASSSLVLIKIKNFKKILKQFFCIEIIFF